LPLFHKGIKALFKVMEEEDVGFVCMLPVKRCGISNCL